MAEIEKKWYVLRAISGKEAKVKEYLEADLKNSDLGEYVSQVLIPTEKVYQVRNGKKIVKERSYLPGYVLVEAALVGEVAHHLRNTPNVIGFLGGSEKPVPLRQSEVNRILGTVDELQETGEELNIPYVVGETVKVTFGPFSGFSGIIEEVNSERQRLNQKLREKTTNRNLLALSDLEVGLVYLVTGTKQNVVLLEQIKALAIYRKLTEKEKEQLDDALIEAKQAVEMTNLASQILDQLSGTYNNLLNNNLNDTMKFLTVWSLILTVPTIVTGFFGMNLQLPFTHSVFGWGTALFISLILSVWMLIALWRRIR